MIEKVKKYRLPIIVALIFILITGYGIITTLKNNNTNKNHIGIALPENSIVVIQKDNHNGVQGEGEYYSEVQLTKYGAQKFISETKKTGKWLALPLPQSIQIILYGGKYGGRDYNIGQMSKNIPKNIQSGMYYVRDRFAERYPDKKNVDINSRKSWNVTIAILDFKTNKLYIYELDT
jgi:hypothetical protein